MSLGLTITSLKWRGTFPVVSDKLTILEMTGNKVSKHSLSNKERRGSRAQVLTPDETKYFPMSLIHPQKQKRSVQPFCF